MPPQDPQSEWKGTYFIGRYRVVDEIGVGGMASVYLARVDGAGGFQKWVAIKRIHPHLTQKEHVVGMFLDEARIAASINHPNVAQVFDLGQHEGGYWIAMEYLHGEPVREIFRHGEQTGVPTEPSLVARIIADAAEGLHAAHDLRAKDGQPLNLVHRDVSPHNLFVTYDGVVKVVDFGIAKVAGRQIQTRAGVLRGKLAYMSPEQARCKELDRRTDVFALGVVAWELLTGHRLFRDKNDLQTVRNVLSAPIPKPSSVHAGVPPALDAVVMRALERDPGRRFATARELSRALQQLLVSTGQLVGPQEIASFLAGIFRDRFAMREAHLKWAAEVTQTVSIDRLLPDMMAATTQPNPQVTGSIALPLVRAHNHADDTSDWEQPTIPRGRVSPAHPAPPPPPLELEPGADDDELRTEVAPTWGVERDRVVRSLVHAATPQSHLDDPPPPLPRPTPSIPVSAAPAATHAAPSDPSPGPLQTPPLPAAPSAVPRAAPPALPWARYMIAATVTFVAVAVVSLALVFAFRARIRSALGIPPPASASAAHS